VSLEAVFWFAAMAMVDPQTAAPVDPQDKPFEEVSVTEVFDRAPVTISATYSFQCGDKFATLLVQMPHARTPFGARVPGIPNATAYLNGVYVGDEHRAELEAVIRSVGFQPWTVPTCSSGRPYVRFEQGENVETWFFPEP